MVVAEAESNEPSIVSELKEALCNLDQSYCQFEEFYVFELMLIERDARSSIIDAI